MRWFLSNVLGGVVRWATATVIAAVFLVVGFSPTTFLVGHVGDFARVIEGPFPRLALVAIGVAIPVILYLWDSDRLRRKIPLVDAARIAYERSEGTPIGETADTIIGPSIEHRLQYFVHAFLIGPVPLYGKKPPSTISRQIPIVEMKRLVWVPSTNAIRSSENAHMFWDDVFVYRGDLNRYTRKLRLLNEKLTAETISQASTMSGKTFSGESATSNAPVEPRPLPPLDQLLNEKIRLGSWILIFNPTLTSPRARKKISFNAEGTVGEGRNRNESDWKINNGLLEIYRENGLLQNKFRYEEKNNKFICTSDPNAKGIRDQVIYRND